MYRLSKGAISKYIRSECSRRLRLDLYASAESRRLADAPDKDTGRPGLRLIADQGRQYERECYASLLDIFGVEAVRHGKTKSPVPGEEQSFEDLPLDQTLEHLATAGNFALEVLYPVTESFVATHKLTPAAGTPAARPGLAFGANRPDIILSIAPTGLERRAVEVDGQVVMVEADDQRIGLRVIDVKLSEQPSPAHFAELAYYGMTLAGWLRDNGHADRFVVLADAAIWPGSHEGSGIRRLEEAERRRGQLVRDRGAYYARFAEDLEEMPAEVVLGRVVRFLAHDLHEVLQPEDWRDLPLHISSRCIGCDYLGFAWQRTGPQADAIDQRFCAPEAIRTDHLSRIAGLTEGACGKLAEREVNTITALSAITSASPIFDRHQNLRATRHIVHARASSLRDQSDARLPDRTGTSAIMPRFSDIRVALSADYDVSSGLTFVLGARVEAFVPTDVKRDPDTGEPLPKLWGRTRVTGKWQRKEQTRLILKKTVDNEGEVFVDFLARLRDTIFAYRTEIRQARQLHGDDAKYEPTIQFYLWDSLNFDQFCKMMGRHLDRMRAAPKPTVAGVPALSPMAWIFPPDEVVQEADHIEQNSPITIVSEMVRLLAANIPYHYGQGEIANVYRRPVPEGQKPFDFRQHPFYADPLSDQIPSERGHEVWAGNKSPFKSLSPDDYREDLRRVVSQRLMATLSVADRLTTDLSSDEETRLTARAPTVTRVFGGGERLAAVAQDLQVIYQHQRLMEAANAVEVDLLMATPPFEREARFKSIRLVEHLRDAERQSVLNCQALPHLVGREDIWVFRISHRSTEAKMKEGDFNLSLLPEDRLSMRHWTLGQMAAEFPVMEERVDGKEHWKVRKAAKVRLVRFDRASRIVIVEAEPLLQDMVEEGVFSLEFNLQAGTFGIIDPIHSDFFVGPRLEPALKAIGTPRISVDDPVINAQGMIRAGDAKPRVRESGNGAIDFLWRADQLAQPGSRDIRAGLATLTDDIRNNASQSEAVRRGLTQRLTLLWGPPGTGKSATSAALLVALLAQARADGKSIRIAITGPTWIAIDNVLRKLPERIDTSEILLARLQSTESGEGGIDPLIVPFLVPNTPNDYRRNAVVDRLTGTGSVVVGATAQQIGKLMKSRADGEGLFDFLLIDEASQMDVAHATVALTALAPNASVTVVGDDLQMAPIHPIDPPVGAEHLVGSIYDFFKQYRRGQVDAEGRSRRIEPVMLDRSYRSNSEIVAFVETTGYKALSAEFPDLRMHLIPPLSEQRPSQLSSDLHWSSAMAKILDPAHPLVAVVHSDRYSSQRNDSEAALVSSLVATLVDRLVDRRTHLPYEATAMFERGVGIVTPHRAQQSAVIEQLIAATGATGATADAIVRSVDTVERFQGQEKDVMFASFGLGDGDQIATEEEFLYNLNRFNVVVSRAKTKMVVVLSRRMADYLPKDIKALRDSRLLKNFVYGFLRTGTTFSVPGLEDLGECELRVR